MTIDNIYFSCTRITHARACTERQITRCGIRYVRNGQYVIGDMEYQRPMGYWIEQDVDCMTCLVKDEEPRE